MEDYKKILIAGGTGFIGSHLVEELLKLGHYIKIITRSPDKYGENAENLQYTGWNNLSGDTHWADAVINLAGENIFGKRWTDSVKKRLKASRISTTEKLVAAMEENDEPPETFISASAIGYYGNMGNKPVDETNEAGDDFLARLCVKWEHAAKQAESLDLRLVIPRIGIVLQQGGGALEAMIPPFKMFVGGPVGSGEQYMPWIHMDDIVNAFVYAITSSKMKGIYNFCAPNPVTMKSFSTALANALNRPSFFKVPEFALKIALGEAATPILSSIRAEPRNLLEDGFTFEYDDVEIALNDVLAD